MDTDFIVIGAGSAGCAVAGRLAEIPGASVTLLEAGGRDTSPWLHIPVGYAKTMYHPTISWGFSTEPEPELHNRRIPWPRGRVVGGTSAINGLVYLRGQVEDFNHWRQLGCVGWGFEDVLPFFRKAEDNERGADEIHGAGGPLGVSDLRDSNPISAAFIEAAVEIGLPRTNDFNGIVQEGAGWYQTTTRHGRRCSAYTAYLRPRPHNVRVETGAQTRRLLFEGSRCVGVEYSQDGEVHQLRARREVILSGGAIHSPQILMLSGIGEAGHLQSHGISVLKDVPNVGRNLQDHFQARLLFRATQPVTLNDVLASRWGQFKAGLEYLRHRTGPLTYAAATSGLFAKVLPQSATPDVQFHFIPFSAEKMSDGLHKFPGFTMSVCQLRPESRGTVTLASGRVEDAPLIQANYLTAQLDRDCMVAGLQLGRRLAATDAMRPWIVEEFLPGPAHAPDDAGLLEFCRQHGNTIYHPSGTCRMGEDEGAVVDSQLRVRGIEGLRVADASIMPTVLSGNTNAGSIMIGEKCAAMIKAA
ncbi:choline dehydrogenase [Rhodovarius crocodyli]|uniref:Choline dehydrogenase n=1 Tax=Rhodovarius crocodyli TaxID=1979269 RepID=A0A437MEW0_9PROT|nr:GMC family oxidoreductase N-terminal domain-containing protein [Rhodovarius crocodyli]RVT96159.1 choline dehydrogenase [Rhodovarius crocodyli]